MRPRRRRPRIRAVSIVLTAAIFTSMLVGLTAANSVATSRAGDSSQAVTAEDLKPSPDCDGITLTTVVAGANGTNGADLLLGTAGVDNLDGKGGDDCILGGGGNDNLRGSGGTDVCIGGAGVDTFHPSCETQIQ
jgi:Ca2+-binding RTX toxin-like protein